MTRFLIVFRHGKSDWNSEAGTDHARPLKKRGIRAAQRMGRFLAETGQIPDLVLASSAVRARTTAELALEAGDWNVPLEVLDELYLASVPAVLQAVSRVGSEVEGLCLAGHEPTSSALVAELASVPTPEFPTATMARIDFDGPAWSALGPGRLAWLKTPRELEAEE